MARIQSEKGKGGNFQITTQESNRSGGTEAYDIWEHKAFLAGIRNAARSGCFIGLALTSDRGAWSVTIVDGSTKLRTYISTRAECDECALALRDRYSDAATLEVMPGGKD